MLAKAAWAASAPCSATATATAAGESAPASSHASRQTASSSSKGSPESSPSWAVEPDGRGWTRSRIHPLVPCARSVVRGTVLVPSPLPRPGSPVGNGPAKPCLLSCGPLSHCINLGIDKPMRSGRRGFHLRCPRRATWHRHDTTRWARPEEPGGRPTHRDGRYATSIASPAI